MQEEELALRRMLDQIEREIRAAEAGSPDAYNPLVDCDTYYRVQGLWAQHRVIRSKLAGIRPDDSPPAPLDGPPQATPQLGDETKTRGAYRSREESIRRLIDVIEAAEQARDWSLTEKKLWKGAQVGRTSGERYLKESEALKQTWERYNMKAMYDAPDRGG